MAKKKSFTIDGSFFLQLSLGLFFLAIGLTGLGNYNSTLSEIARFFGNDDTFGKIVAIVELVMGGLLLAGLFFTLPAGLAKVFGIALFALWALIIAYTLLFNNFMKPELLPWLYELAWRCVILASLWMVGRKYM